MKVLKQIDNMLVEVDAEPVLEQWHHNTPIRVAIPIEVKKDWLLKRQEHEYLGNYPEIAALLDYVKSLTVPTVDDGINLYIYLEEVYPEHEYILNKYGVTVERR